MLINNLLPPLLAAVWFFFGLYSNIFVTQKTKTHKYNNKILKQI